MTEQQWLFSTDPRPMLDHVLPTAGERKLHLWCDACRLAYSGDGDNIVRHSDDARYRSRWYAQKRCSGDTTAVMAERASLLREIFGNPVRQVTVVDWSMNAEELGVVPFAKDWLTPDVRAVAATIDASWLGTCSECSGKGVVHRWREKEYPVGMHVMIPGGHWEDWPCLPCQGTGQVATAYHSLMPVLADALEEAGCTCEEVLRHCRGQERCPGCLGVGMYYRNAEEWEYNVRRECSACKGTGWLPSRGPHVRGCWVIDLVLGKY